MGCTCTRLLMVLPPTDSSYRLFLIRLRTSIPSGGEPRSVLTAASALNTSMARGARRRLWTVCTSRRPPLLSNPTKEREPLLPGRSALPASWSFANSREDGLKRLAKAPGASRFRSHLDREFHGILRPSFRPQVRTGIPRSIGHRACRVLQQVADLAARSIQNGQVGDCCKRLRSLVHSRIWRAFEADARRRAYDVSRSTKCRGW